MPLALVFPSADTAPSMLKTGSIIATLVVIVGVVLAVVGLRMIGRSNKGDMAGAARQSGVALFGLFWVVLGALGTAVGVATALFGNFFDLGK